MGLRDRRLPIEERRLENIFIKFKSVPVRILFLARTGKNLASLSRMVLQLKSSYNN